MWRFIALIFIIWRLNLELLTWIAKEFVPLKPGFLGSVPWSNFDGGHYLLIAQNGYGEFEQAFFPLYPLLIRFVAKLLGENYIFAGIFISNLAILLALILFWKLLVKIKARESTIKWALVFFLFFPTSYYFASIYSESVFLLLVLLSLLLLEKKQKLLYVLSASLASATRLVGLFLLVPIGLFGYMYYLLRTTGDALLFIHAQPEFGANRSGGEIILLPQVLWRYLKIFTTVSVQTYDFWIALLEVIFFIGALILLWIAWKRGLPRFWIFFSTASILGPTLTGSLSSMPRYILVAFPIFIVLAQFNRRIKLLLYTIFYILHSIFLILFAQGYWIS